MTNKCMVSFLLMAGVCLTATASPKAIPFRVVRNLMVIQATVNWQTGNFIFDTGTSGMVLNARYFEGRTDLTTDCGGFQSIIGSNDGCRGDFVQLHFEELSVRGYAAVVDLQPLEQSKRMSILGILGLQALKQYEIVIDYHYEEIWMIGEGSPYIFSPEKDEWIDLSKLIASDGLFHIIADIEYHPASGCWVIGTGGLTRLNPGTQPQSFSNLALDKPVKASSREDDNIYFPEYAVER